MGIILSHMCWGTSGSPPNLPGQPERGGASGKGAPTTPPAPLCKPFFFHPFFPKAQGPFSAFFFVQTRSHPCLFVSGVSQWR